MLRKLETAQLPNDKDRCGAKPGATYVLYWYLEFEAKRLCGEADIRRADGDEFATGKWELASCQCPYPRTVLEGIEDQP
jgi:hypothetical protein